MPFASKLISMKSLLINTFFSLIVFISFGQLAIAQDKAGTGKITGSVIDSASNQPIGFATISLKTEKDSLIKVTVSKGDGHFQFENALSIHCKHSFSVPDN